MLYDIMEWLGATLERYELSVSVGITIGILASVFIISEWPRVAIYALMAVVAMVLTVFIFLVVRSILRWIYEEVLP